MIKLLNIFSRKRHAATLREYMEREGIKSQYQLAERLGVSAALISLYFTGKVPLGSKTALRIQEMTGVPIERLITKREANQ